MIFILQKPLNEVSQNELSLIKIFRYIESLQSHQDSLNLSIFN